MINIKGDDIRIKSVERIIELNLPVYIYGNGVYGRVLNAYLRENGVKQEIQYVIDDRYYKGDEKTISLSELLSGDLDNNIIVIGIYNYETVKSFKKEYGDVIKYIFDFHMTSLGEKRVAWDASVAESRIDGYQITYEMLDAPEDKRTMELYLRAAVNGEFDSLYNECRIPISYFNSITKDIKIDALIDCGAYDGDSIHDFVEVFPKYQNIYAIEPDPANRDMLLNRIEREKLENVEIVPYGVYKESCTLHFSNEGTSSAHIDDTGAELEVIAIDNLVDEKCEKEECLMIKMDIEGCEMDALRGAERTIKEFTPCLTICVYHKETDLIEIPQYIDSLVEKGTYRYKLGFHGTDLAEFVFYAIPTNPRYQLN